MNRIIYLKAKCKFMCRIADLEGYTDRRRREMNCKDYRNLLPPEYTALYEEGLRWQSLTELEAYVLARSGKAAGITSALIDLRIRRLPAFIRAHGAEYGAAFFVSSMGVSFLIGSDPKRPLAVGLLRDGEFQWVDDVLATRVAQVQNE